MAAFDFPSSPSVNQTYTANGVTWKWNGTMWMRVSGAGYLEKIEEGNSKVEVDDSGSGFITATTDGTERFRIASNGYVGMNLDANVSGNATVTPWTNLHVVGSNVADGVAARTNSTPTGQLHVSSSGYGINKGGTISLGSEADNVNPNAAYASISGRRASATSYHYQGYLTLNVSDGTTLDEKVRITSGGDILVNHTDSDGSGKLQVFTNSQDGIDIFGFSNSTTAGGRLTFYRSKSNTVGNFSEVADGDSLGRIDWRGYNDDGTANNLGATIEALVSGDVDSTTDMPSDLVFKTSPNGSSSPTEKLRITSAGSVGIGTDNPQGKLHVSDGANGLEFNVNSQSAIVSYDRVNTVYRPNGLQGSTVSLRIGGVGTALHVDSSAKVGIGTDIPQSKLEVAGTISQTVIEYPTIRPTLDLNFAATKTLDRRITFTRDSLATYYGEDGLLKYASNNVPRFDHDPDTRESLGLLIEHSSTNLISGSGGYGSDIRGGTNLGNAPTTEIVDGITLPDGTVGQVRRLQIHSSGNSGMRWGSTGGGNINTAYSASVWARAVSGTASFTIDTNDHGNASYSLTEEWVRMKVTGTTGEGAYQFMDIVGSANANGYFWGFQLENKPFVSSYIPVASNESSKTRAQDNAKITGTNFTGFYNQNESTLFVNYKLDKNNYLESPVGVDMVTFRTDGNSHGYELRIVTDTSTPTVDAHAVHNSLAQYDLAGISLSSGFKDYFIAKAFKLNDVAVSFDGATPQTDNTVAVVERDTLYIGYVPRRAHYKSIKYFNKRLPNAQLQGLTSQ